MRDLLDIMGARSWRLGESGSGWNDDNNGTMKMGLLLFIEIGDNKPISHASHEDQQASGLAGESLQQEHRDPIKRLLSNLDGLVFR